VQPAVGLKVPGAFCGRIFKLWKARAPAVQVQDFKFLLNLSGCPQGSFARPRQDAEPAPLPMNSGNAAGKGVREIAVNCSLVRIGAATRFPNRNAIVFSDLSEISEVDRFCSRTLVMGFVCVQPLARQWRV